MCVPVQSVSKGAVIRLITVMCNYMPEKAAVAYIDLFEIIIRRCHVSVCRFIINFFNLVNIYNL